MFIDDLYALKNRYPERLQLHFVFSQEDQEFPISAGRLDADKVRELYEHFCQGIKPAEAFVCGPDTMIRTVTDTLVDLGFDSRPTFTASASVSRGKAQRRARSPPPGPPIMRA